MAGKFVDGNNLKRALDYVVDGTYGNLAKQDGSYDLLRVGEAEVANNLTPYDESAGADQNEPFSFQATGTANGSQSDFATGSLTLMKEKRGNSVVVNQLAKSSVASWTDQNVTYTNNNDGTFNVNGTPTLASSTLEISSATKLNHIYFYSLQGATNAVLELLGYTATRKNQPTILLNNLSTNAFAIRVPTNQTANNERVRPLIVDLTQWFGSNDNIPADLLAHPENWARYYQGSLAYNAGQIVNANSRYIKCIGRNQWDEEWESGGINASTGENESGVNAIRSKNYIEVIPNATYFFKVSVGDPNIYFYDKDKNYISPLQINLNSTFTIPSNCCFIRIRTHTSYGTTYNHDITISLYYEGESGYNEYYPYEVLTNNDTGTEELKSAGNVADSKAPNGTITRKVGNVDLGTLDWELYSTNTFKAVIVGGKSIDNCPNICSKYEYIKTTDTTTDKQYKIYAGSEGQFNLYIIDSSYSDAATFKTAMDGVILHYELATPTTEQGTPFSENLVIDDFGSMEFAGTSGVPQGNLIFYPVDYKAFIDTLYDYTEGTPSDIALKSDITKIYEHNITMVGNNAGNIITLRVYNNNSSAISSASDLVTLLRESSVTRISCSGGITYDGAYYNVSYWTIGNNNEGFNTNKCSDGTYQLFQNQVSTLFSSFNDEVKVLN